MTQSPTPFNTDSPGHTQTDALHNPTNPQSTTTNTTSKTDAETATTPEIDTSHSQTSTPTSSSTPQKTSGELTPNVTETHTTPSPNDGGTSTFSSSTRSPGENSETPSATQITPSAPKQPSPTQTSSPTEDMPPTQPTPTASPSPTEIDSGSEALAVNIHWQEDYPTVPHFSFEVPTSTTRMTLDVYDGPFMHTYDLPLDSNGQITYKMPMSPGVSLDYKIEVVHDGGELSGSGTFTNGRIGAAWTADLLSTYSEGHENRADFFLLPLTLIQEEYANISIINQKGETLWQVEANTPMTRAHLSTSGRGVWTYEQDKAAQDFDPNAWTYLKLIGWTGQILEEYYVPAGHHDWAISEDESHLEIMSREEHPELEVLCGSNAYRDIIQSIDLASGLVTTLWTGSSDQFPLPSNCQFIYEDILYTYLNGYGRTTSARASTGAGYYHSYEINPDGDEWFVVFNDEELSDLSIKYEGENLPDELISGPHGINCFDSENWSSAVSWDEENTVCIAQNRRIKYGCDTIDFFWTDENSLELNYLASFPPADGSRTEVAEGCFSTINSGNAQLIGRPNQRGNDENRVALFGATEGSLQILELELDATTAKFVPEYIITPAVPGSSSGKFMTAYSSLGSLHTVTPTASSL